MRVSTKDDSRTLLSVFDSLAIPALIIDTDRKIVSLNSLTLSVFQYPHRDIIGRDLAEIIFLEPGEETDMSAASQSAGEEPWNQGPEATHYESICKKKNGEIFVANVSIVPYQRDDLKVVVVHDLSHHKKLQQRASQRAKEISVFNTFAKILTRHTDTNMIMKETIDMLLTLMGVDQGWIYLMDEEAGKLSLAEQRGFDKALLRTVARLAPGECFTGKVFASGRPLLVKKASEDPRVVYKDAAIKSMAGVPITSKGTLLGVLGLGSKQVSYFTSLDTQLLTTIASELGVAIENTKLIGQLNEKMRQIELINELIGMVNSSLSIGTIFRMMVSELRKMIDYHRASLLLYNEKDQNLVIFALDTEMETILKRGVRAPLDTTSAGWVIKNNQPWINANLEADIRFPRDRKLLDEGIRSTISIPLFQDRVLGVFNLDSAEPSKYSERDLKLLLPVAKHISIALENAFLFEEVSKEKKEWEKTFDAMTDMVWIEDGQQCVIRANYTLLNKTGLSALEVSGKKCSELLSSLDIHNPTLHCSKTFHAKRSSFRELKGNGGSIYNLWSYPLNTDEGHLYAIVRHLKDVTAEKRLEMQLIRTDKLASLGTLVAGIAHEINNPLGIIAGYSEALIERAENSKLLEIEDFEDFPEYLTTIHNEIFRCKRILGSLLDFSRPTSGTFRQIDINELIKEVILLINHKAAKLNHSIHLKLNRDLPKICAEPGSLRQLFMNIIINSLYFTPEKGVISIRSDLDSERKDRGKLHLLDVPWIKVSVTDTGLGIPHDILDKVFDPFFTTKPVGEGTGLGLSICHKIVEEHSGSIDVESDIGVGTTITLRFPAKAQDDKSSCS
ncbi:MAG: GAF domain-containing protein [Thermodesulfovibrionales bacterium]|jgi:two-component system NtrC family sensor kinase